MGRGMTRVIGAVAAGVVACAVGVSGAGEAGAATPGPVAKVSDLKGTWVGRMVGYQESQVVDWQYRLTVRKTNGHAGVAWETWRDCAGHERACAAGTATGTGWSAPTRVLFAMSPDNVIHAVSQSGFWVGSPTDDGMMPIVMTCAGLGMSLLPMGSAQSGTESWGAFATTGTLAMQPTT